MSGTLWVVLVSMSGLFGRMAGSVAPGLEPAVGAMVGLSAGAITASSAATRDHTPGRSSQLEWIVVGATSAAISLAVGGETTTVGTVAAVVLGLWARMLVRVTVRDESAATRLTDDTVGAGPVDRIRLRVITLGALTAAAVGVSLGAEAGLSDLDRPAVRDALLALMAWFVIGIAGTGAISWRARRWRWDQDGVDVDDGVGDSWAAGVLWILAAVGFVMVLLPIVTVDSSSIPGRAVASAGGLGQWLADGLDRLGDLAGPTGADPADRENEPIESPIEELGDGSIDPPPWVGDLALTVMLAAVFGWVIRAARNARFNVDPQTGGRGGWSAFWTGLGGLVVDLIAAMSRLFRWLKFLLPHRRATARVTPPPDTARTGSPPAWSPEDPNRRLAGRAFALLSAQEDPRRGETPLEVAHNVGLRSDADAAARVGETYVVARYSSRAVTRDQATEAQDAVDRVIRRISDQET